LRRLADTTNDIQSPHLKVSALEMTWYMRHQLLRDTDWASMAHSLEIRTPLVDSQLLCRIAPMLMRDPRPTKRDMAQTPRSQLPTSVLNRPKTGFTVPVRNWLLKAFDPSPGAERGLRGWTREVYSVFADTLENHHASLQRQRKVTLQTHRKIDAPTAARKLRLFVLLTDGFGGFGGIAKFNRDFLAALCSHNRVEQVTALPRIMPNAPEALPPKLTHVICGLGGKRRYVQAVIQNAKKFRADNHSGGQSVVICAHIHLLPAALLARRICGGGLHLIVHGVDAWKPTRNRLANACVRRISGFISVSNVTKRRFMRWSHLRDDQGVVLPNCVDLSAFCPGPKSEALLDRYQLRGKKVLLTLGRLASEERYKGFDEVLEVMPALVAQIPNVFYLICGDGQDRQRLECKAVELGIRNRVIFAGRISDGEKADHYRLADAYIMPGWGEGFGIVYLEALACGIPVIGSKADGSREALLNGQLGILVDPRDSKEIISAVLKILRPGAHDERRSADVRSSASEPISAFQSASISASANGHSVDYFSAARFEQRVHDIVDCISS